MGALNLMKSTSLQSYAGYAWEFLRLNPKYRMSFERSRSAQPPPKKLIHGGYLFQSKSMSKAAEKWGLQYFADPALNYLNAPVFWTEKAFPKSLAIGVEPMNSTNISNKSIQFSDISCTRHHLLTANGLRQTVLKSSHFWLQFFGYPNIPSDEKGRIIVHVDGGSGLRKRLDVLSFLADLRDNKPVHSEYENSPQSYENLQFYWETLALRTKGISYRGMAETLFGRERVKQEWDNNGCSLKSKIVRACARGNELSQNGYLDLLKK